MALLRLQCSTSTSTQHSFSSLQIHNKPYSQSSTILSFYQPPSSFHLLPLSLAHSPTLIRTKEAPNFTLRFATTSSQEQIQETETETEEFSRTRLLAQNVPWTSTPEDIRSLFERHGKVLEVEEYEGRIIKLNYARPKKKITPPPEEPKPVAFNLFVANLPYDARSKDLREFFESGSGRVVSTEIIFQDNPRRSSGYGFVSFKSKKEANAALSEFQGKIFMGRPLRVAPSRRFVKLVEESATPEDTSSELSVNEAEADKAD